MNEISQFIGLSISQALTTTAALTDNISNIVTVCCSCATAIATCVVVIYNMWKAKKTKQELYGQDNIKDNGDETKGGKENGKD